MKIEHPEAPSHDEPTPDALRAFVRARQRRPSKEVLDRVAERLANAGVLGGPARTSNHAAPVEAQLPYLKIGLLALAIGGALLLSWRAAETRTVATTELAASPPALGAAPAPSPSPPTEPSSATPEPPVLSVDQLPSVAPPVRAAAAPSASSSAKAASTELELVQRAQAAIASDPERALALTSEHARAYPAGVFAHEREVIAVEALSRLGRRDESWTRALTLVRRYPRTPYARRLELALGRPLPEPSPSSTIP